MMNLSKNNSKNGEGDFGAHNQIAKGTDIQGDIKTDGVLRIDGTLVGSIESTSKLVVGPSGRVEGNVICASAHVSGEIKGKVIVKEQLTLQATGKLHGELTTGKLAIEPGAVFTGSCSMGGVVKDFAQKDKARVAEKSA